MIKSILVAIDGSVHSEACRRVAVRLARVYEAGVTGLHVVDVRLLEFPPFVTGAYPIDPAAASPLPVEILEGFRENADRITDDFRDALTAEGIRVQVRIEEGVPSEVISEVADAYDLLVVGKRGAHARFSEDLVGSTAEQIVRKAGTPVYLAERENPDPENLLLLYDGSRPANNALKLAADFASHMGTRLRVLTVSGSLDEAGKIQQDARDYLAAWELEVDFRVVEGELVFTALEELEETPADLVFLGKRGHSFLHDLILGSTTEQLMRETRVPLVLVP
ncbi:MAG: universal stress protein [Thermoleophilia bacterium]